MRFVRYVHHSLLVRYTAMGVGFAGILILGTAWLVESKTASLLQAAVGFFLVVFGQWMAAQNRRPRWVR